MKKMLLVALLACAIVALMAGTAFASMGVRGYLAPSGSPHGNFTLTSKNCGVCHAVHDSDPAGEAMMHGTVAEGCTYCHITNDTGYVRIYNDNPALYATAVDSGTAHDTAGGALCTNCHQVHAAATQMQTNAAYLVKKILKSGAYQGGVVIGSSDESETQVSKWCTRCHPPYYNTSFAVGGQSHVMATASATYSAHSIAFGGTARGVAGRVATNDSIYCYSCHSRGQVNRAPSPLPAPVVHVQYSFPHNSDGYRFLSASANTSNSVAAIAAVTGDTDDVCYACHRGPTLQGGSPTGNGAGLTW